MPYVARRYAGRSRACSVGSAASYVLVLLLAKEDGKPPADETMQHVYLLRSLAEPKQTYIGLTDDMRARLKSHNEGANFHTAKYRPWELVCCVSFKSQERAAAFEKYLKVGSGHAFAHRHLW